MRRSSFLRSLKARYVYQLLYSLSSFLHVLILRKVADFIDINWNVAFSGRSPKENSIALWADLRPHDFNMTASEDVINDLQHAVERARKSNALRSLFRCI